MKTQLHFGLGLTGLAALMLAGAACGSSNSTSGVGGSDGGSAGGHDGGVGGKLGGTGGMGVGGTGVGGAVCTTAQYTHTTQFGSSFDGFGVPANNPTTSLAPVPGVDGGPPSGTIQTLDGTDGSPTPGSAKLQIPFSGPGQQLLFAENPPTSLNLTGTTVTAQIKLDDGIIGDPVNSVVRAFLVLKTTAAYNYATGVAVNLDKANGWTTLTMVANTPDMLPLDYNPCDVREIDVEIDTGQMGTYTSGVVHIDSIAITAPGSGDGGADASDAASDATVDAPASTPDTATDTPASTPDAADATPG